MTNSELIEKFGGGGDLFGALYLNNIGIFRKLCYAYQTRHNERMKACGVEFDDLMQECYFAVPEALEAYRRKGEDMAFTSFLKYPVINRFNALVGYRTTKGMHEPLNNHESIDKIVSEDNSDITYADTIVDEKVNIETDVPDKLVYSDVFPTAKAALNDFEYDIILQRFRHNKSLVEIGNEKQIKPSKISADMQTAFTKLRRDEKFSELAESISYTAISKCNMGFFKNTGMSSVEWAAMKLEKLINEQKGGFRK